MIFKRQKWKVQRKTEPPGRRKPFRQGGRTGCRGEEERASTATLPQPGYGDPESQAKDSGACQGVSWAPGGFTRSLDGKEARTQAGRPGCRNGPAKHGLGHGDPMETHTGAGSTAHSQALSGSLAGGPSLEAPGGSRPPRMTTTSLGKWRVGGTSGLQALLCPMSYSCPKQP